MSIIAVSNASQLTTALSYAQSGDTITLAAGNYGDVVIKSKLYTSDVTITSQSASSPATLNSLTINNSSHIHADDLNIHLTPTLTTYAWSAAVGVTSSSAITLTNSVITGGPAVNGVDPVTATSMDSTGNVLGQYTGIGVSIYKSSGVVVSGSNVSQLDRGVIIGASDHVNVNHDDIHDLRRTAVGGGGDNYITIDSNHLHDSHPWKWGQTPVGDHADFVAFWTDPNAQTSASTNIQVTNNLMEQGKGTAILGMWLEGDYGNLGFTNVTITGNAILNGNAQGIMLRTVSGATVDSNTLLQTSGDAKSAPGILLNTDAIGTHIDNNITSFVTDNSGASATTVQSGNQFVQNTDPTAAGYYDPTILIPQVEAAASTSTTTATFSLTATTGVNGGLNDMLCATDNLGDVLTASSLAHIIVGGSGNDTLNTGCGSDTLTGGAGADIFHFGSKATHDTITDFGAGGGHDVLDVSAYFSAGMKAVLHDVGSDVTISFANGEVITLTGVHSANLIATASGFTI